MTSENHVLLVDDEPEILEALSLALSRDPVSPPTVETAGSAAEGLEKLQNGSFALVISDFRMPGMNGVEFLEKVRAEYPDIVRGLLTGFHDLDIAVSAMDRAAIHYYLQKPWETDELRAVVREALRGKWKSDSNKSQKV